MNFPNLTQIRRLAVAAVLANLAAVALAAIALPGELMGVLPVMALTLPLLTIGALDALAERRGLSDRPERSETPHPIPSALQHRAAA